MAAGLVGTAGSSSAASAVAPGAAPTADSTTDESVPPAIRARHRGRPGTDDGVHGRADPRVPYAAEYRFFVRA
ncbi:MAG: hypothetical protein ACJ768_24955 [Gaiellaceae bacterium]